MGGAVHGLTVSPRTAGPGCRQQHRSSAQSAGSRSSLAAAICEDGSYPTRPERPTRSMRGRERFGMPKARANRRPACGAFWSRALPGARAVRQATS